MAFEAGRLACGTNQLAGRFVVVVQTWAQIPHRSGNSVETRCACSALSAISIVLAFHARLQAGLALVYTGDEIVVHRTNTNLAIDNSVESHSTSCALGSVAQVRAL